MEPQTQNQLTIPFPLACHTLVFSLLHSSAPPTDLEQAFADSTQCSPIVFLLSAGTDPLPNLLKLARQKEMEDSLTFISLGQ